MIALYTDGTPVQEGDRVRYHQAPGGLMAPPSDARGNVIWHYGIAAKFPGYQERREELLERGHIDPDELHCLRTVDSGLWSKAGSYGHMAPHIIERVEV